MGSTSSGPDGHHPCPVDAQDRHRHELADRLRTAITGLDGLTEALSALVEPHCTEQHDRRPLSAGAPGAPSPGGDDDVFAALRGSARFELLEVRPTLPGTGASGTAAHQRLIVGASAPEGPSGAARLSAVTGRGVLVRVAGLLPLHIAVADRKDLAVALDLGRGPALLHTSSAPATAAQEVARCFLQDWWPRARPCGPALLVPPDALTGTEAAVIEGLALGLTDESVARRVGVTPRTVRRHVAAVSERFGATSRLQLGLLLGRAPATVTAAGNGGGAPRGAPAAAPPATSLVPAHG